VNGGPRENRAVAIVVWGILEDYLDPLGVSLEQLCCEFTGSYVFGFVSALQRAGVRPVLIYVSCRVTAPLRCTHRPTGATLCILPASRLVRVLRARYVRDPEARTVRDMFGSLSGLRRLLLPICAVLRETLLYLETPVIRLARELWRQRCTAILCQEYEYARFDVCVLLGRLLNVPVCATFQGGNYQVSRLERISRPLAMRLCTGLIIASEAERVRVRARYGVSAAKIARIFNPIDHEIWAPLDRPQVRAKLDIPLSARVAVWHGRISIWTKGLDVLLEAWALVCARARDRDLRLILIGSGPDAEALRRAISKLGSSSIQWIEQFVHDRSVLREYLAAADVYVFPSRHEGFAVAPIEGMACGLPITATDVSGLSDILADGEASGGVVVPQDDPEALAIAMARFLDDEAWSRTMGQRARARIDQDFALAAVGRRLRAFIWGSDES
jgi:glycosyltransferase involved in cell wall biosynthesis